MSMNGILNVNKPAGITSFGVVARLKRLLGEKRAGHIGTLDPMATGVLPVCLGRATRIVRYLIDSNKTYLAGIRLGITTDTYDREGTVVDEKDTDAITVEQVKAVLASFQGTIEQVPPQYSAVKYRGKRSCDLARAGIYVELKPRQVRIYRIELLEAHMPVIKVLIECSKGTYIRTLAHDAGRMLGCGAHLIDLTRTGCGTFRIEDALPLDDIEHIYRQGKLDTYLYPVESPLADWQMVVVNEDDEYAVRNGRPIALDIDCHFTVPYCRVYNADGVFIAVLRYKRNENVWHPERVFARDD
jgi:tRNA pseudouridine55 synthase